MGYGAGFMGAIAAIFMIRMGISVWITDPLILLLGIGTGLIQGLIIGKVGVPAFVTTLAFEFIFRGLMSLVTSESGTIPIDVQAFNAISNGFVPDIGDIAGLHALSLVVGLIVIVLMVISQIRTRKNMMKYNSR